jgi:hypothetical protein
MERGVCYRSDGAAGADVDNRIKATRIERDVRGEAEIAVGWWGEHGTPRTRTYETTPRRSVRCPFRWCQSNPEELSARLGMNSIRRIERNDGTELCGITLSPAGLAKMG